MIRPLLRLRRRRIMLDIDTQKDQFIADGNACVRNHRRVLMNIRRLNAWARKNHIKTISTEIIYPNSIKDNHNFCKTGTQGAKKLPYCLRSRYIRYESDGYSDLNKEIFRDYDQVIFEKRTINPFDEPRAERMLSELTVDEIIVYGATVEEAVFESVLGLIQRGKRVTLVSDAIGYRDKGAAESAIKRMEAKGAKIVETKDIAGISHLVKIGVCHCDRCQGKVKAESSSL